MFWKLQESKYQSVKPSHKRWAERGNVVQDTTNMKYRGQETWKPHVGKWVYSVTVAINTTKSKPFSSVTENTMWYEAMDFCLNEPENNILTGRLLLQNYHVMVSTLCSPTVSMRPTLQSGQLDNQQCAQTLE